MELIRQDDQPAFADILWSRPVTKVQAKRLLIIGGNTQNFSAAQDAYQLAQAGGIGECKVVLPAGLKPMLKDIPDCLFLPQTPSGSLGREAYEELAAMTRETDGLLLPGSLGRNDETTSLLERLVAGTDLPLVATSDTLQQLAYEPRVLATRANTLLVSDRATIADFLTPLELPVAFTSQISWQQLAGNLKRLMGEYAASWIMRQDQQLYTALDAAISITRASQPVSDIPLATLAAVFWLQHEAKPFAAVTTAAWTASQIAGPTNEAMLESLTTLLKHYDN